MRSVEFHPEAEAELASAAQYFENHVEHLGMDFIVAVRGAYDGSSSSQTGVARSAVDSGGPSFAGSLRPPLPRREPSRILIVAVAHLHRPPGN